MSVPLDAMMTPDTPSPRENDYENKREEIAQVNRWLEKINQARQFDNQVYSQMAIDRAYARGESSFPVNVNLAGGAIDMMTAFLYSRNPDVACEPAASVSLPRLPTPIMPDSVKSLMAPPPMAEPGKPLKPGEQAPAPVPSGAAALPPEAQMMAMQDMQIYQQEMAAYTQEMTVRRQARDQKLRFCNTLEIVISKSWLSARLKRQAGRWVRAALTTGVGWIKVQWNERTAKDAVTLKRMADLQTNLSTLAVTRQKLESGTAPEIEALEAQYQEELVGLLGKTEVLVSRGLIVDLVNSEDMTFPLGVTDVLMYVDSPWIDQRIFMTKDEAQAMFPEVPIENWGQATTYSQRRPVAPEMGETPNIVAAGGGLSDMPVMNPSQFIPGATGDMSLAIAQQGVGCFVAIHETWDRDAGVVRTMCEGMKCYVKPVYSPDIATSRFYGFFGLGFTEADNTRYPQSLVWRSYRLIDEFNSTRSNWKEARQRSKLGVLFNKKMVSPELARKLESGVTGEWTGIDLIQDDKPMSEVFWPKPYTKIDPLVYDTSPILRDFERVWGIQEALQGSVTVEKTATEAEIQQQGLGQMSAYKRDLLEGVLTEMATYTAEIVLQRLSTEDVKVIAGPGAVWVEGFKAEDLATLVDVSIAAGTTGKPNTTMQRDAWGQLFPVVSNMVTQIAQLRQSSPNSLADALENLLSITLDKSGDTTDVESLVPQDGDGAADPNIQMQNQTQQAQQGPDASSAPPEPGQMGSPLGGMTP